MRPPAGRADPPALADHLIRLGKLSRFQAHKLLRGTSLGLQLGPYQIQTPIGRGGMGTVYLALDTRNRPVRRRQGAAAATGQREGSLPGPFSARDGAIEESGPSEHRPDARGRRAQGRLLHRHGVHSRHEPVSPGDAGRPSDGAAAARLFAEVAAALDHAHGLNLIHRDLKPSNIMITPNDHAKVLDFGLAVFEGEDDQPVEVIGGRGYMVGSLDYMAPEQTENSLDVDARTDLYAIGCSLYFTLVGQPPFPGGGRRDKVQAHRYLDPRPLLEQNGFIPPKFAAIVEKLMAKTRNDDTRPPGSCVRRFWRGAPRKNGRPIARTTRFSANRCVPWRPPRYRATILWRSQSCPGSQKRTTAASTRSAA